MAANGLLTPVADPRQLPPPSSSGDEIRRAAREILARPEFRPPQKSLWERAVDWVRHLVDRALSFGSPGTVAGLVVLAVVLALVIALLWRIGRTIGRDPSGALSIDEDVGRPATDWRAEAARHEATGEWRDALRCRYRALVADLAGRGLVDEIPGRTTGEYRAEVAVSVPAVDADFATATDLFERAWYGAADAGPDENERFRGAADRVLHEVSG